MVGSHPLPRSANDADLLEVAFVEQRQVLPAALREELFDPRPADLLPRRTLALAEHHRGPLELHAGLAVHQWLQLCLAGACRHAVGADRPHSLRGLRQALLGLCDELPLVVQLVLLELHVRQCAIPARRCYIRGNAVVVGHLRLHRLFGVEAGHGIRADQMLLREDRLWSDPTGIGKTILHPEDEGYAHESRPLEHEARVGVGDARRHDEGEDQDVEGDEANEEVCEVVVRDLGPSDQSLQDLALEETRHEVAVLLPDC
mmetsp:Transcript_23648/g.67889  ORF Transcript_23648/g.67889 Transcript_23648/m.67889 type:complete len:259 (-) Transcript_23648:772-1548(-)